MKDSDPPGKIIGLTGGIGSGKTTVAHLLQEAGFPVYYSDDRAKDIVNVNPALKVQIQELLGAKAYNKAGYYDRKYVAGIVFNNDELLLKLNNLIHPAVRKDFENWTSRQTSDYLFKETALLFELGLDKECWKSLLVTADDNLRMKRVMDRDGKTYREVESVIEKQMAENEKIKRADFIIYNNSDLSQLRLETEKFLKQLNEFAL